MTPQRNTKHTAAVTQAKRRSGGICEICGWPHDGDFHHEYPAGRLIAVCRKCHKAKHHNGSKTK